MKNRTPSMPDAGAGSDGCQLRILGLHADAPTHAIALRLLRWLAVQPVGETRISTVWFSFDRLASQTEREIAAVHAACAHMILYSGYGERTPPATVRALIEAWSRRRHASECPVVALICTPAHDNGTPTEAETFLQGLALRAGQPLFLQRVDRASLPHEQTDTPRRDRSSVSWMRAVEPAQTSTLSAS